MEDSTTRPLAPTESSIETIDRLLDALRNDLSSDIERVLPEEYQAGMRAKLTERIATLREASTGASDVKPRKRRAGY